MTYTLVDDDRLAYARKESHQVPGGTMLKPPYPTYMPFSSRPNVNGGRRLESVNALRILSLETGITPEDAAGHKWGEENKPVYVGFNHTIKRVVETIHSENGVTNAHFEVSLHEEHGNKAHCDVELKSAPGCDKLTLENIRTSLSTILEANFTPKP